jgi:hypothetical protein
LFKFLLLKTRHPHKVSILIKFSLNKTASKNV